MATATRDQGKTSFVKDFLNKNPRGNVKAVKDAWKAAGMKGSIGSTLIKDARSGSTASTRRRRRRTVTSSSNLCPTSASRPTVA